MRFNKDTESTARTVEELDAFRSHKPHATVASPIAQGLQARIAKLQRLSLGLLPSF